MAAPPSARHFPFLSPQRKTAPCARTARRKDDVSGPVSWLAGHNPSSPSRALSKKPSGIPKKDSPPTVAGAASDLACHQRGKPHRIPFADQCDQHPKREHCKPTRVSCQGAKTEGARGADSGAALTTSYSSNANRARLHS